MAFFTWKFEQMRKRKVEERKNDKGKRRTSSVIKRTKTNVAQELRFKMSRSKGFRLWSMMINIMYIGVTSKCLEAFICGGTGNRLLADPKVECSSTVHVVAQLFAGLTIVILSVGAPFVFAKVMIKFRDRNRARSKTAIASYGPLYEAYKDEYIWYEVVILAYKLTASICLKLISFSVI